MTQMTDEQLHESYVAKMGEELGQTFSALERELTWMYWRWMQHRALFGEKPKRIDLLNETASFFFSTSSTKYCSRMRSWGLLG